jgi:ClpP class serine protease
MLGNEVLLTADASAIYTLGERVAKLQETNSDAMMREEKGDDVMDYARDTLIEQMYADTAVLTINGSLIPKFSWIERYFDDVISYEAIQAAVTLLLEDEDTTKVVLFIDSPGGYARGCGETADLLAELAKAKDIVVTHTSSLMASGAYWLGSQAHMISSSRYSLAGSIGAYTHYFSRARMLNDNGVDIYVARSAEKKGVPSGVEPISEIDKKVLDKYTKGQADMFIEGVLRGRKGKLTGVDWRSGESFQAKDALSYGLIDTINTATEVIQSIKNS